MAAAPEMENVTGNYYNLTTIEKPAPHALDRAVGKKVWEISEVLTGLAGKDHDPN